VICGTRALRDDSAALRDDSAPFSERGRVGIPQPVHGVPLSEALRIYPDCTCGKPRNVRVAIAPVMASASGRLMRDSLHDRARQRASVVRDPSRGIGPCAPRKTGPAPPPEGVRGRGRIQRPVDTPTHIAINTSF